MRRAFLVAGLTVLIAGATAVQANDLDGRWGFALEGGFNKLIGGYWDYSNVDQTTALTIGYGLSPRWNLMLSLKYANVRPGVDQKDQSAGWSTRVGAPLATEMFHPQLRAQYRLAPDARWSPWLGASVGRLGWRVIDMNTASDGLIPDGDTAEGYDKDGTHTSLQAGNLTLGAEAGLDYFISDKWTIYVAGRYHGILSSKIDNVGMSGLPDWGPDYVDANTGIVEGVIGVSFWLGSSDRDKDGITNRHDGCPDQPEDIDGYADEDGCPDLDNDGDGILDVDDECPDEAEDIDGYADEDGCPDPDNDGDGIIDAEDECPDEAEDIDGYLDEDGCPDPDNDGDGVLDADDECPDTPADVAVDERGCPTAVEITADLILEGVNFVTGSAELTPQSIGVLARVAESLRAHPDVEIEVRGHTDATGGSELNREISRKRALAVRDSLVEMGIAQDRVIAVGLGEDYPIADNGTAEGRRLNRRVEIHRTN